MEFVKEDISSPSQVLLPVFTGSKPMRKKSSGGSSAKSWLMNIKSPIGEPRPYPLDAHPGLLTIVSTRYDAIGASFTSTFVL